MDKQKKEQLILLIAVVVFVIMIPQFVFKKKVTHSVPLPVAGNPADARKIAGVAVPLVVAGIQNEAQKSTNALPQEQNQAEALSKDPFEIPANVLEKLNTGKYKDTPEGAIDESESISGVNLQGFVWGGDSPVAIINDKAYKKGDMVGDVQILDIDKKGVIFLYNGRTVLMRVKK